MKTDEGFEILGSPWQQENYCEYYFIFVCLPWFDILCFLIEGRAGRNGGGGWWGGKPRGESSPKAWPKPGRAGSGWSQSHQGGGGGALAVGPAAVQRKGPAIELTPGGLGNLRQPASMAFGGG